jgi:hypothetical protein
MSTIIELTARLIALRRARDSGALMVRHGDQQTQFRSLTEITQIIAQLEGELAELEGTKRRGPHYVIQKTKGY